jgi:hypothetical protein
MAFRILLVVAAVALAGCTHHDNTPTSTETGGTGGPTGLNRIDTVTAHQGVSSSPR